MLIDSHCHLDFSDFDADRAAVIARAKAAGVTAFVNPGCTLARSRRAVELATEFPEIYAAVGVHPHDATSLFELRGTSCSEVNDAAIVELRTLAGNKKVVAVGEIGLDYFRLDESVERRTQNVEQQKVAFRKQLQLARELTKPVILHTRDKPSLAADELRSTGSEADTLAILDEFPDVRGVAHCFTGSREMAEALVARGWLIGFTGIITFKNATGLREIVRAVPLERILIETDAPYLAPEPYRGERAEPAHVIEVARKIAELKNVSLEEVARVTAENTRRLFEVPFAV